jgi:LPXTG-motif cell wall-anchored protein
VVIGRPRGILAVLVAVVTMALACPLTANAQPWLLAASVKFDKDSYRSGDAIRAELTITNTTSARLDDIRGLPDISFNDQLLIDDWKQWGDLTYSQQGISLAAGASHTVRLTGKSRRPGSAAVTLSGYVFVNGSQGVQYSKTVPVNRIYGGASGILYADRNGSGGYEPGEQLPSTEVSLQYNWENEYTVMADRDGRFVFENVPAVDYAIANTKSGDWTQLSAPVRVTPDGTDDLRVRAVRVDLSDVLEASISFAKTAYRVGELAHIKVMVTNHGDIPLTGIVANCNRAGNFNQINGTKEGWGDLVRDTGVTIGPGRTEVYNVTEAVPQGALIMGRVMVACDFGYIGADSFINDTFFGDEADVPGGAGDVQANVGYYPQGNTGPREPVAGVRAVLVDDRQCPIEEKTTDDKGEVRFEDLRAGYNRYSVYFFPPAGWRIVAENPWTGLDVRHESTIDQVVEAAPGEGQLPVLPQPSPECAGQPPGTEPPGADPEDPVDPPVDQPRSQPAGHTWQGSSVELADTGADVIGIGIAGLVFVLLGIGGVVAGRRRHDPTA